MEGLDEGEDEGEGEGEGQKMSDMKRNSHMESEIGGL